MKHRPNRPWTFRAVAVALVPLHLLTLLPARASASERPKQQERPAAPKATPVPARPPAVTANRTLPKVQPPPARPVFSARPTDREIFRARVFEEPLAATHATSPDENQALAQALTAYLDAPTREDVRAVERFLEGHPGSAWTASLLANLGIVSRRTGYFTSPLAQFEEAWRLGKDSNDPAVRAIAERAVSERAGLLASLGRQEDLSALLQEIEGRSLSGSSAERVRAAREALWLMENRPEEAFRCGPIAVGRLLTALGRPYEDRVVHAPATRQGTSLAQLKELAGSAGLTLRAGKRVDPRAALPSPAIVHFKTGHFATIVAASEGRYLVADPAFEDERWLSAEAVDAESSGYVLAADLPAGFSKVGESEGGTVWGRGCPNLPLETEQNCVNTSGGSNCGQCLAMAGYTFLSLLAALRIVDTPVNYTPPRGPAVSLTLTYNQKEVFQPSVFTYTNVGPKWTFDAISYVEDDPTNATQTVRVYGRGGGMEVYPGMPAGAPATSAPHFRTRALLVRTSTSPILYERRLPDGSIEVFSQPDGAIAFPRKVFLTEHRDPQGNAVSFVYDGLLRLVAIADAIGQVTSFSYSGDSLRISAITDPYGRSASIAYDAQGRLISITDVLGITSSFTYGASDFITSMTTPYGTTRFSTGHTGPRRWIEAEDPLGGKERLEYVIPHDPAVGPRALPVSQIPAGFEPFNGNMDAGLSLFWDKRAMLLAPGDIAAAEMTHWLEQPATHRPQSVIRAHKKALEGRVWYGYPGQVSSHGPDGRPIMIGRKLDDGSSQVTRYEYNPIGKTTRETDPLGRETVYEYDSNGIDFLRVKQKNGTNYDLLWSTTYNTQHLPLTVTDAAGQTATFTYNAAGQVETVTTPPRAGITENRTTTFSYDTDGYPQNVTGPLPAAIVSFTYDGYGRVRTMTDPDGHTLTHDYDALDRVTKVTHPDGTYEETVYNRLDTERQRDRLGRWTHTFHDALRRVVATRDPLGRTVTQEWCTCGSLDKLIDAEGKATTWERDVQGRVVKETRADGSFMQNVYEATTSRLKDRIDRKNQTASYQYYLDDALKQASYTNAENPTATVNYTYDSVYGRPLTMTDGTGTTTWTYNPVTTPPSLGANQLASVSGPVGASTYTISLGYDELGRVVSRSIGGASVTASLDALGRVVSETSPLGVFGFSYDGATNRLANVTYPNGQTTSYLYHDNLGDNRIQEIKHLTPGATVLSKYNYTYYADGNVKTWSQQLGTNPAKVYTFAYDGAMQLASAVVTGPSPLPVPSRFAYAYDKAGNRIAEQLDDAVMGASHNNLDELVSTQAGGPLLFRGVVSEPATVAVGSTPAEVTATNAFQGATAASSGTSSVAVVATDASGNTRTNTYQVSQSGAPKALTYDLNGNLVNDGTRSFEWDAANRLVAVQAGTHRTEFTYDGLSQRVRILEKDNGAVTSDKRLVWCGTRPCQERDATGAVTKAFFGAGFLDGGATYFTTADHLGSIREVTDVTGAIAARYDYDPYGRMTRVSGTYDAPFGFTGHYFHPLTSLALPLHRAYAADLGRWISEDPAGRLDGPNLYQYVRNNPANLVDPTGLSIARWLCRAVFVVGGSVVGAAVGGGSAALASGGTLTLPGGAAGAKKGALIGAAVGVAVCGFDPPDPPVIPIPGPQAQPTPCPRPAPPPTVAAPEPPRILPFPPPPPPPPSGHATCIRYKVTTTYCMYKCTMANGTTWTEQTRQPFCPSFYIQKGR